MSFEPNKNAKELGIDTTKEFRVVRKTDVDPCYSNGDILTLERDDNYSCPYFINQTRGIKGVCINWYELEYADEPKQPTFANQIITDIKDQEQADRIGKKLDSMGYKVYDNIKWRKDNYNIMKVAGNGRYYIYNDNEPYWTHITANKFLGEDKPLTLTGLCVVGPGGLVQSTWNNKSVAGEQQNPLNSYTLQHMVDRAHYWGLTGKFEPREIVLSRWRGIGIAEKLIYLELERNKLTNKYNTPTTPSSVKGKNIMSSIVNFAKDLLLSPEEKLLRKYGLHDENGNNTSEARQLINDKFYDSPENQAYLLEVATAKQAEDKSNK